MLYGSWKSLLRSGCSDGMFYMSSYQLEKLYSERHIERLAHCEVCSADQETIKHVLLGSTVAQQFWQSMKDITAVKVPRLHGATWARGLLQPNICLKRTTILCGMWSLLGVEEQEETW